MIPSSHASTKKEVPNIPKNAIHLLVIYHQNQENQFNISIVNILWLFFRDRTLIFEAQNVIQFAMYSRLLLNLQSPSLSFQKLRLQEYSASKINFSEDKNTGIKIDL